MKVGSLDAVSNRETFQTARQIIDTETGEPISLTDVTLVFEIRRKGTTTALLSATNDSGIEIINGDTYQVTFSVDQMRTLCAETYEVGLTAERDDVTSQVIIGTLPVLDGVVS